MNANKAPQQRKGRCLYTSSKMLRVALRPEEDEADAVVERHCERDADMDVREGASSSPLSLCA